MKKIKENETSEPGSTLEVYHDSIIEKFPSSVEIIGLGLNRDVTVKGKPLNIAESHKVLDKSAAFNWGYEGSGPAQLALALMLKYIQPDVAVQYYQVLKVVVIAQIKLNNFKMDLKFKSFMTDLFANKLKNTSADGKNPYFGIEEYVLEE